MRQAVRVFACVRDILAESSPSCMGQMCPAQQRVIFHPLFFALAPVLFLYTHNNEYLSLGLLWIPILLYLAGAAIFWGVVTFLLKHKEKAALISSAFIIIFSGYGHLANILEKQYVFPGDFLHVYLLTLSALFFTLMVLGTVAAGKSLRIPSEILNNTSLVMLLFLAVSIGWYELARFRQNHTPMLHAESAQLAGISHSKILPNIYYIILDAHGRTDVLKELYHYDNSAFIASLEKMGFYVAKESRTNYCQTRLSLASSLNMLYLDKLTTATGQIGLDETSLTALIGNNTVCKLLKQYGYRIVTFSSGYDEVQLKHVDLHYAVQMNEFNRMLLDTTLITGIMQLLPHHSMGLYVSSYALHRARVRYTLDHLPDTTTFTVPLFVFAHLLAPHPPFVFGPNGESYTPDRYYSLEDGSSYYRRNGATRKEYLNGYHDEVCYLDREIVKTVRCILAKAKRPTVIIIQGDHGPGSLFHWDHVEKTYLKERYSILNAYYFSGNGTKGLYSGITPVNSFRVLMNRYFDARFPLLPDRCFFPIESTPYQFMNVTDIIQTQSLREILAPSGNAPHVKASRDTRAGGRGDKGTGG